MEGDSREAPVFMLSAGTHNHVVAIADIFTICGTRRAIAYLTMLKSSCTYHREEQGIAASTSSTINADPSHTGIRMYAGTTAETWHCISEDV